MAFIKVESEELKIEETFRVKNEETEEQPDLMSLKEEGQDLNGKEEKDYEEHDFITEVTSFNRSQTDKTSQEKAQKTYFTCQQCGKSFSRKVNLNSHMRVHTRENPCTCPQCGKSFNHKGNFNRHIQIHTGETPYICQQCGKSFKQKTHFQNHIRVHTGEKPFTCQQCGKDFNQKESLKKHMRIHTGEKPYICQQCGKDFNQKGGLDCHMRIHTGEKPFICDLCGKNFRYNLGLSKTSGFGCEWSRHVYLALPYISFLVYHLAILYLFSLSDCKEITS
ncbi:gastrula zinc finger protein XlCGF7.1-like [Pseudorasbora parva]|uniref:gastrula zinc finger protein XlCGF7.1-like n=1 Tax=Pseudorasbora parva TaxID=51549 RepID=UPI00351F6E3F